MKNWMEIVLVFASVNPLSVIVSNVTVGWCQAVMGRRGTARPAEHLLHTYHNYKEEKEDKTKTLWCCG
jgi:hypothetical protein